ncbi:MAG: acetate--CoA ligase family protein, partial [Spirochaetaceae bacterium]|jgi:acetyltransferase|nr:acetate--CoA ligase family protein [Spirochaetaceae bacterium]
MITPIHNPAAGKLRVIGYVSGSGDTLWRAYDLQKEIEASPAGRLGECPFEIVGVFSSSAQAKALAAAEQRGIPGAVLDIKEFYRQRGKPLSDRALRREYDEAARDLIRPMGGDAILLAGYVWATTDCLLDEYLLINVHPADLTIRQEGKRLYAGGNGVGDALKAWEPTLSSSSHLATAEIDGGPLLVVSERIPVDYTLHRDEPERMRYYLALVNEQNRQVGARTLLELALGNFALDEKGAVYYQGKPAPLGVRIECWEEAQPRFRRRTDKLLYPDSVAVIGASQKPGIGRSVVENILRDGYKGTVYAVNVRGEDVLDAPGYPTVEAIEGPVDLAVIATPASAVLDLAESCGRKGVRALICISAGFKEIGGEGIAAQEKLVSIADRYNMRLIGPNCMGQMNVKASLNATILAGRIARGNVAMVTQSGSIGAAMLDYAEELGIGFSSIVSLGNQADLTVCDLLPFYEEDPHTKVIVLYLESIAEPARFWRLAARMRKPILLLKAGSTAVGMAAASSHTGSLTGNDQVVDALIRKAGITRLYSLEELYMCAAALANMPMVTGNRVAHLTNAGGPSILISDALSNYGFTLPPPADSLKTYLRENLFREASVQNPVDIVAPAPPEHYVLAAQAMMESGDYDALLICCVPPATVDTAKIAEALIPVLKGTKLPVLTNFFGPTLGKGARDLLIKNGIPTSLYPEQIATMLAGMRQRPKVGAPEGDRPAGTVLRQARGILSRTPAGEYLPVTDAYALLELFGVRVARSRMLKKAEDARHESVAALSFPVVAKIDHPEIVHKSDVGGVRLNINSGGELAEVAADFFTRFPGATGVFVQEQVPSGLELIVGGVWDPQLGSAVMAGLGGVWVEIMKDLVFGYPPVGKAEALDLLKGLRCAPLLAGYRGNPGVNREALAEVIARISTLLLALPGISEVDLNPVIYDPARDAFIAADARIRKGK